MRQTLQSSTKMAHNEAQRPEALTKHHSPIRWIYLCLLLTFVPFAYGAPFSNESSILNSTESDQDLFEIIQKFTTSRPNITRSANTIRPIQISNKQWHRMIDNGPMITRLAFDVGTPFRPTYAYVTSESYEKYAMDLEQKCRKIQDDNIADKQVDSLDNEYFKWEDHEFNKALLKALFPETVHGDHRRFLNTPKVIHQIRLSRSIESQCQRVEQKDDWSAQIDERTNFEDYLINLIFQPRYVGDQAQAIIEDIQAHENMYDPMFAKRQIDEPVHSTQLASSPFSNSTLGQRKKRAAPKRRMNWRRELEEEARQRYHEAKARLRL